MAQTWRSKSKDDWRRWSWNRIAERIPPRERESSIVLYLPGVDDLERAEAIRHGFCPDNLIGIEYEKNVCRTLRKNGVLCIHQKASNVVTCWPMEPRINVVSLDFFGGLSESTLDIFVALFVHPAFSRCVVSLNFLRGRDPFAKWHPHFSNGEHRGDAAVMQQLMAAYSLRYHTKPEQQHRQDNGDIVVGVPSIQNKAWERILRLLAKPKIFTYASSKSTGGNQKYDSVVFDWDMPAWEFVAANPAASEYDIKQFSYRIAKGKKGKLYDSYRQHILEGQRNAMIEHYKNYEEEHDRKLRQVVRRSISPILAHRTMRMRGAA